jgi:glycosyltransferase involved in cell wall biosynthesis
VKIALVDPVYPFRGGIAHYTSMLARALGEQQHRLLVVSYRRQYPSRLYPGRSDRDPSTNVEAWRVEAEFLLDLLWPPSWRSAAERIRGFAPDLVVLQWWTTVMGPLFWVLARHLRRAGLRVAFVIHNVLPHEARPGDVWLTRRVLRHGHAFLVQSESELARLRGLLPQATAVVVPHPVHIAFGERAATPAAARRRLGLPATAAVILLFGIVRPYKGLNYLIQAVARLHQAGRPAHLLVAGEFWDDRRAYERTIQQLGLADYVHMNGRYIPNEEVAVYFSAADVFAAPYVGGTQSAAVKVALGFGVPIVTTRSEDVAGQPGGPLGAQVVPAGDVEALAAALAATLVAVAHVPRVVTPGARNGTGRWDHLARVVAGIARPDKFEVAPHL